MTNPPYKPKPKKPKGKWITLTEGVYAFVGERKVTKAAKCKCIFYKHKPCKQDHLYCKECERYERD